MVYLEHKLEENLAGNFKGSWFTWTAYKNRFLIYLVSIFNTIFYLASAEGI